MGKAHFQNNEIRISWEPTRPATVFFSCETVESTARKAWFEVFGESLCMVFNSEKKPVFEQKLSVIQEPFNTNLCVCTCMRACVCVCVVDVYMNLYSMYETLIMFSLFYGPCS